MLEYKLGFFAVSLCGHDKGRLYMIVSEEGESVGLADGIHRGLANPKKKKKKHVQMIRCGESAECFTGLIGRPDADARIREAVLSMKKKVNGES
ncbi:MAG: hypothetical protein IJ137_03575 [Eubacterium sp.]|nr:hypothetical protein [Eubacterium sp.]